MKITMETDGRKLIVEDVVDSCQSIMEDMVVPALLCAGYQQGSIDDVIMYMSECIEIKERKRTDG